MSTRGTVLRIVATCGASHAGEIQRAWAVQAREAAKKEFENRKQEIARLKQQLQGEKNRARATA
jgi:hypothetical protein